MSGSSSTLRRVRSFHFVPVVFAVSAVSLAVAPRYQRLAVAPAPIPATTTDPTPVRVPSQQPLYRVGIFTFRCSECHRTRPEPYASGSEFTKHSEIRLAHGTNTRCLNCHHPVNRDAFVDDFGEEIPWEQPPRLCARCHGPVYRDWEHGSHGRINGHWDTSQGELVRLKCIQCHDPHHPPFQPLASAPAPRTLHGRPHHTAAHSGTRNPLRLYDIAPKDDHAASVGKGP
jgi:hypothetical protein